MAEFQLTSASTRLVLTCLDDSCGSILRKIDNLRKMKGSIDDALYKSINTRYQEELQLVQQTVADIEEQSGYLDNKKPLLRTANPTGVYHLMTRLLYHDTDPLCTPFAPPKIERPWYTYEIMCHARI